MKKCYITILFLFSMIKIKNILKYVFQLYLYLSKLLNFIDFLTIITS